MAELQSKKGTDIESNVLKKNIIKLVYGDSIEVTGVTNVVSYNDKEILLKTSDNQLLIKGESLNIEVLNLEQGEVKAKGKVSACSYVRDAAKPTLLKRIFK